MEEIQQLEVAEALAMSQLRLKRQNTVNTKREADMAVQRSHHRVAKTVGQHRPMLHHVQFDIMSKNVHAQERSVNYDIVNQQWQLRCCLQVKSVSSYLVLIINVILALAFGFQVTDDLTYNYQFQVNEKAKSEMDSLSMDCEKLLIERIKSIKQEK